MILMLFPAFMNYDKYIRAPQSPGVGSQLESRDSNVVATADEAS